MIIQAGMFMRIDDILDKLKLIGKSSAFSLFITWLAILVLLGSYRFISWPRPVIESLLLVILPVPEALLLFGFLIVLPDGLGKKIIYLPSSLYLGILLIWNGGELFYRWNYRENFLLFDDLRLLPSLISMLSRSPWFRTVTGSILILGLSIATAGFLGYLILRWILSAAKIVGSGRLRKLIGFAVIPAILIQVVIFYDEIPTYLLFRPASQAEATVYPQFSPKELESARQAFESLEERPKYSYEGIADGDIHLLVVESYGHTLLTNPIHRKNISPVFDQVSRKLSAMGWSIRSGLLDSPAFGGRSWLADATLITGRRMVNQQIFNNHIYTSDPNLSGQMSAAGYHTVYAAPGTRRTPEDWKDYYGFDEYLIEGSFGWKGPMISFGNMSDQYFLDFLGRRYSDTEMPIFLSALLVSSHVPFVRIPQYIDDWNLIGDGSIYESAYIRRFRNNWLGGSEYPEGYVYSIEYVLKSILGYIERYVDDDALVVIVGDHQPKTPISERTATTGVPLHFLSRDKSTLTVLDDSLFSWNFIPDNNLTLQPMEHFPLILNILLQPKGALSGYFD